MDKIKLSKKGYTIKKNEFPNSLIREIKRELLP